MNQTYDLEVNLSQLQQRLDIIGLEIVENQNTGLLSRKKLAEQTKGSPEISPHYALSF